MSIQTVPRAPAARPLVTGGRPAIAEFAHIRQASAGGRAAVFVGRCSQGIATAALVWEGAPANSNLAVLDAFTKLVHEAQHLAEPLVIVPSTGLMRQLVEIGFLDPQVIIGVRQGPSYLAETLELQRAWLHAQPTAAPRAPRVVATDASVGLGRGSAGIACVDERGCYHAEQFASRDVLYCELKAVLLALQRFPGPLRILTDSRSAIRLIDGSSPPKTRQIAGILAQVRRHLVSRQASVEWVRGHAGHPLNEAADQLALAARRRIEFAIPGGAHQQICRRITASLAAASPQGEQPIQPGRTPARTGQL